MGPVLDRIDASIAGLLDFGARSHVRALILITILACLITLPGLQSLPVTDRDEARYAQASKQMMETGDYIDIRNLDAPRWKKPVGIYWLQVASAKTFGDGAASQIWAYRLPSAIGIILASMLTYWALAPLLGSSSALVSGLVVASTATTAVEAHIAKTDAVLLACTVVVFGAFVRMYHVRARRFSMAHWLLWAGLGLGFLVKGPIILIPFAGALLWLSVAERSTALLRAIAPFKGLALFALIAAPWYIAIGVKTDGAFFAESLGRDLLGKVGNASENHGGPFGYYLATMWVTFWPWTPLVLLSLPLAWAQRNTDEIRIFAAWIIPCWAVFALTTTKLPHYILPILPAIAGLIGMSFTAQGPRWLRILAAFLFVIGSMGAGIFAIGPVPLFEEQFPLSLVLATAAMLATIFLTTLALLSGRKHAFAGLGVATLLIMFPTLTLITAPRAQTLFISPRLLAVHENFETCSDQPIRSTGYAEMSLAFLGGTDTRFISFEQAAAHLSAPTKGRRVFVRLDDRENTLEKLAGASGKPLENLGFTYGLNYNSGKTVRIAHVAVKDDPALADCKPQ